MPDESSIFYQAGSALKEHLGKVDLFASRQEMLDNKARIHAFEIALQEANIPVPSLGGFEGTTFSTQSSLSNLENQLSALINLRATTVSLGNVETRVNALETEIDGGTFS